MPQSFDPDAMTLEQASQVVAIQAVISVGREKQAMDVGNSALIGGGLGLGTGLLASALSKRKKKRWLRNAILGSLLGAGVGAAGAAGKNWWDQRQAPGVRELPKEYNAGGIETPESVQRRLDSGGTAEQITPETYQDEAGLSQGAADNIETARWAGVAGAGGAGSAAGHALVDAPARNRAVREAVRTAKPEDMLGKNPAAASQATRDNANELKRLQRRDAVQSAKQQARQRAVQDMGRVERMKNRMSHTDRQLRRDIQRPLRPSEQLDSVLAKGTSKAPGYKPVGVRGRLGAWKGKLGGGLAGLATGLAGNYLFGRDLTDAYRNAGTTLSGGVD